MHEYTSHPDFDPVTVGHQSQSAKALCAWCKSVYEYATVIKDIEPKKRKVRAAEIEMHQSNAKLHHKERELQALYSKLDALKEEADSMVAQKKKLEDEVLLTEGRRERAFILAQSLTTEETRWQLHLEDLDKTIGSSVGDSLLCAAAVAYSGPFSADFRQRLASDFIHALEHHAVVFSQNWTIFQRLADHVTVREWELQGLPADEMSAQSAAVTVNSIRVPFLIDPQNQANQWLRKYEKHRNLLRTKMSNTRLLKVLEECLRAGIPVMIEDCPEDVPTSIEPVLCPLRVKDGGKEKCMVRLGESMLEMESTFALYICTTLQNPALPPRIFIHTTVVNFSVTFHGLADQLLSVVVRFECPDIEERRWALLHEMARDQREICHLEHTILTILSETEGNILDRSDLVHTLQDAKATSDNLASKAEEQALTDRDLNARRQFFRQIALRGSLCYVVATSLSVISPMYVFSLSYVTSLFKEALSTFRVDSKARRTTAPRRITLAGNNGADDGSVSPQYLADMGSVITEFIFIRVTRTLFEDHKILYALLMCLHICRAHPDLGGYTGDVRNNNDNNQNTNEPILSSEQYAIFVKGSAALWDMDLGSKKSRARIQGVAPGGSKKVMDRSNTFGATEQGADQGTPKEVSSSIPTGRDATSTRTALGGNNADAPGKTPDLHLIPQANWEIVLALATLLPATFSKLPQHIISKLYMWRHAMGADLTLRKHEEAPLDENADSRAGSPRPMVAIVVPTDVLQRYMEYFPSPWNVCELAPFNQLLLFRALQPKVFLGAVRCVVDIYLGETYTTPPPVQLHDIMAETTERTPIVFVLSEGADPTHAILHLATTMYNDTHLHIVSLGQGQGQKATRLIHDTMDIGRWALLQNCHLVKSWLPKLEQLVVNVSEDHELYVHSDFRMFLTSRPIAQFPTVILQTALKVVFQVPKGIRMNLQRSVREIPDDTWNKWFDSAAAHRSGSISNERNQSENILDFAWRRLLFALCFFHAAVQERRSYGSVGFNIPYAFSESDLETSRGTLELALTHIGDFSAGTTSLRSAHQAATLIPWNAMEYLIGHVHYGGRVTDEWDRRCVLATLRAFMCAEVLCAQTEQSGALAYLTAATRTERRVSARRASRKESVSKGEYDESSYTYSFTEDNTYRVPAFLPRPERVGENSDHDIDTRPHEAVTTVVQLEDYIRQLPLEDLPTVFGLHPNACFSLQVRRSRELLDQIRSVQGVHMNAPDSSGATNDLDTEEITQWLQLEKLKEELPTIDCFDFAYVKDRLQLHAGRNSNRRRSIRRTGSLISTTSGKRRESATSQGQISSRSRFVGSDNASRAHPKQLRKSSLTAANIPKQVANDGSARGSSDTNRAGAGSANSSVLSFAPTMVSRGTTKRGCGSTRNVRVRPSQAQRSAASGKLIRRATAGEAIPVGVATYDDGVEQVASAQVTRRSSGQLADGVIHNAVRPRDATVTGVTPTAAGCGGASYRRRGYRLRQGENAANTASQGGASLPGSGVGDEAMAYAGNDQNVRRARRNSLRVSRENAPDDTASRAGSRRRRKSLAPKDAASCAGSQRHTGHSRGAHARVPQENARNYTTGARLHTHRESVPACDTRETCAKSNAGSARSGGRMSSIQASHGVRARARRGSKCIHDDGASSVTKSVKSLIPRSVRRRNSVDSCAYGSTRTRSEARQNSGYSDDYSGSGSEEDPGMCAEQTPMRIFLQQETERYKSLITEMNTSVSLLIECVKGTVLMSSNVESVYHSVLNQTAPSSWKQLSFPSTKRLMPFVHDVRDRADYMAQWLHSILDPHCYMLSYFFFPHGFLTAILQHHARNTLHVPIDEVECCHEIQSSQTKASDIPVASERGAFTYGLILECACWDGGKNALVDVCLNDTSFIMPVVHFVVAKRSEMPAKCGAELYVCPVYNTSERHSNNVVNTVSSTNFVTEVMFPCGASTADSWTLKGVALVLQMDE
eukprot:GEMP01000519.1.p1 GENE.GEMP01000519.1~~GEMP01000519.1.p1  ORF type:complete len:2135 (+),score=506.58 GEMP01000519.1:523-6405(+)